MIRWMMIAMACAASLPALAEEPMLAPEREAYLEACLVITQTEPELSAYRRLGTGSVTRGHASVTLYDIAERRSVQFDCRFAVLDGTYPDAEQLTVTYAGGESKTLDLTAANALIRAGMQKRP